MDLEEKINNNSEISFYNNNDIITNLVNLIVNNNMSIDTYFPSLFGKNYQKLFSLNNKIFPSENNLEKNMEKLVNYNKNTNSNDFNNNKNDKIESYLSNNFENVNTYNINRPDSMKDDLPKIKNNKIFKIIKFHKYNIENCNNIFINKSISKEKKLNIKKTNINDNEKINNIIKDNNKLNNIFNINKIKNLSNEIRVKKNNKLIFMNKSCVKVKKKNFKEKKNERKSFYRGVSKNGRKWQAILYSKYTKGYIGSYPTQEIAARVYDIISIKNNGIKAKTNFIYNLHQIQNISEAKIDFKSSNINEIISNLINC